MEGISPITPGTGANPLQTVSSQDRGLGSDPFRADTHNQAPDLQDFGVPPKSQVKTGLTGSSLSSLVKDQAGCSALVSVARLSLPQLAGKVPQGTRPVMDRSVSQHKGGTSGAGHSSRCAGQAA